MSRVRMIESLSPVPVDTEMIGMRIMAIAVISLNMVVSP
jgi:hypothetical protein